MQTEIEATFLNVDHEEVRKKLEALGAACTSLQTTLKRKVYDYDDLRLDKKAAWVRVRKEVDKTTMSFKQRLSENIDGMKEIEIEVSNYDEACNLLEAIGLTEKASQETKREIWKFDGCEIMLDEWPWIPAIVEVEGGSEGSVKRVSEALRFDFSEAVFDSADGIYQKYFDVTRTEISTTPIVFGPAPEWLEERRK